MGKNPRDDTRMGKLKTKPRRLTRIDLREDIVRAKVGRVDRDKGVIYGVKILGLESVNDRRYTKDALVKARPLYEGIGVYVNHPEKPNDPRAVRERFGRLVNVRLETDGLYGDLEYLKAHPDAALVTEAAERMPEQFGLSHNAKGEGKEEDGLFVIEEIVSARSVDVVTEPATTGGMFERRTMKTIKIKQLFENSWKKFARKTTKRPRLAAFMKRLVEEDAYDLMEEEPADTEAVPEDHEDALKEGFRASIAHLVDQCLDEGGDGAKECLKKIKELVTAHGKLSAGDDAAEDDMEEEEPAKKDQDAGKEAEKKEKEEAEEQRRDHARLKRKDKARDLCEEAGVTCDKALLEILMHLPDEKAMKRAIEREKGKKPAPSGSSGPRSGASGNDGGASGNADLTEGAGTPEGFLAVLMN